MCIIAVKNPVYGDTKMIPECWRRPFLQYSVNWGITHMYTLQTDVKKAALKSLKEKLKMNGQVGLSTCYLHGGLMGDLVVIRQLVVHLGDNYKST